MSCGPPRQNNFKLFRYNTDRFIYRSVVLPLQLALLLTIMSIVGCASLPKTVQLSQPSKLPEVTVYALSLVGAPYRYGKASRREGFDCSGFVRHVYEREGMRLPRTAVEMAESLPYSGLDELRSGDLIFFDTLGGPYSHVGLYVQGDEFVHASSSKTGKVMVSRLSNPYWRKHLTGARRPVHPLY